MKGKVERRKKISGEKEKVEERDGEWVGDRRKRGKEGKAGKKGRGKRNVSEREENRKGRGREKGRMQ